MVSPEKAIMFALDETLDSTHIGTCQKQAIEKNVPFAVCTFVSKSMLRLHQQQLLEIEAMLARDDIPCMVFVGSPTERLFAIKQHIDPEIMFDASHKLPTIVLEAIERNSVAVRSLRIDSFAVKTVRHPVAWPGPVIHVADVAALYL